MKIDFPMVGLNCSNWAAEANELLHTVNANWNKTLHVEFPQLRPTQPKFGKIFDLL